MIFDAAKLFQRVKKRPDLIELMKRRGRIRQFKEPSTTAQRINLAWAILYGTDPAYPWKDEDSPDPFYFWELLNQIPGKTNHPLKDWTTVELVAKFNLLFPWID